MLAAALHRELLRIACAAVLVAAAVLACGGDAPIEVPQEVPHEVPHEVPQEQASVAVSIDLFEPLRCTVLGPFAEVSPLATLPSQWRLDDAQPIDVFLRLPHDESRLALRVESASSGEPDAVDARALEITVATDARATDVAFALEDGELRADLSAFDGEVVRLRFAARTGAKLVLREPRVTGRETPERAPLGPLSAPPAPAANYNIVLYVVDTLRADRLSLYGYSRPTSPNLERMAERALVFDAAYANGPSTLATMPAMFSSRHASMLHAQLRNEGGATWTFPELLRAAGYRTGGFQANPWVSVKNGFDRGFERYEVVDGRFDKAGWRSPRAPQIHRRALAWLDGEPASGTRKPFFLFLQTMEAHAPYDPPPPFRERFPLLEEPERPTADRPIRSEIAKLMAGPLIQAQARHENRNAGRYEGSIAEADDRFAAFMRALEERGLADDTIVFLTADHGEALGNFDDGTYLHGHSLHEELVRVPLVVFAPWQTAVERLARPVSVLDLAPTLLEIAGVAPPADTTGRSLFRADPASCPRAVQGERTDPPHDPGPGVVGPRPVDEWYVREREWKLLGGPQGRGLFDLASDPREERDVRSEYPIVAAYLEEIRRTSVARARAASDFRAALPRDEADQREVDDALRRLGYIE